MNIQNAMLPIAHVAAAMCAAGAALAGPPVQIIFKNMGTQTATYTITNSNERSTDMNATPKPAASVFAGETNAYFVQSRVPDINAAVVRYTMGRKSCVFSTTFVAEITSPGFPPGSSPTKMPKWNKSATASGGAICDAVIKSQNFSDFSWTVEFTMK